MSGRRAPRVLGTGVVLVASLLFSGCFGSDYRYVKNSDDKTYFRIPSGWHLYDEQALAGDEDDLSEEQQEALRARQWQVAFDADPKHSLRHVGRYATSHPTGYALVLRLSPDDADQVALSDLANLFQVRSIVDAGSGQLLAYEHITRDGGFRGVHLVAEITDGDRTATLDQTVLVDQASTRIYAFIVSCTSRCFEDNADEIERVIESWTVKAQ